MKTILLAHARLYPKMEPRDAVKLLYQSEFGGGHMIHDEEGCLCFLRQEYASLPQRSDLPLLEDIGGGMFRVNLGALDRYGYSVEALGRDFIRSAAIRRGSMECFLGKLQLLTELTREGHLPFSPDALNVYLTQYESKGYPPVSHSEAYRAAYHPAYRVVEERCLPEEIAKYRMR